MMKNPLRYQILTLFRYRKQEFPQRIPEAVHPAVRQDDRMTRSRNRSAN